MSECLSFKQHHCDLLTVNFWEFKRATYSRTAYADPERCRPTRALRDFAQI